MSENVVMTPEEKAEFEAFKLDKAKRDAAEGLKKNIESYKSLTDEHINDIFPVLVECSNQLKGIKIRVFESFHTLIAIKQDLYKVKEGQMTHTFTNGAGNKRIMVGNYQTDNYDDTVNEGISIVKEVLKSMVISENTEALVESLEGLMSRDQKGNLKPSKVLRLKKMANKLNNDRMLQGVKIIEDAYQPAVSKTFVRAEYKDEKGEWINVPLGITES